MTFSKKIKTIDYKIDQCKAECNLEKQGARIVGISSETLVYILF